MRDLTYSHHRIIASTGKIEKVLQVGTVISVAVIIVKALADQGSLQASGIATFLGKSWILFLAITVAHLSLATFLAFEIHSYLNSAPPWRDLRQVLDQIESRKNLLTHGLVSRAALTRSGGRVGRLQLGLWPTLAVY